MTYMTISDRIGLDFYLYGKLLTAHGQGVRQKDDISYSSFKCIIYMIVC